MGESRNDLQTLLTRRHFFGQASIGVGIAALAHLLSKDLLAGTATRGLAGLPHFPPTAKRVIYLFQSGGPSQLETLDYKPMLEKWSGKDVPDSVRGGQRLTTFTATQASYPVAPSVFKFVRSGQSGTWVSELLPHTAKVADELCIIKSLYT